MIPGAETKVTRTLPHQPRLLHRSRIPELVVEHFAAIGTVLSVSFGHHQAISQYQLKGRVPVFREEVTDEVHKSLVRSGWRSEQTDGTYRIGDCILYQQPEEERQANRETDRMEWLRLDDEDTWREQIEDMDRDLQRTTSPSVGARLTATHLSPVSAHVRRGPIEE